MLGDGDTVLRHVQWAILALLRPAESAARRLIAIDAQGLEVSQVAARAAPMAPIPTSGGKGKGRIPCFALMDPRRRAGPPRARTPGEEPNVWFMDGLDRRMPERVAPSPDDPVSAAPLRRRLAAILYALDDIRRQARRLKRKMLKQERPIRPMRPGRPPGYREDGKREIDIILADCHMLALIALAEPVRG
jgi:hypothetical protein